MKRENLERAHILCNESEMLETNIEILKRMRKESSLVLSTHGGMNSTVLTQEEISDFLDTLILHYQKDLEEILKEIEGL